MKKGLPLLLIAGNQFAFAQTESSKGRMTFSGYAEAYYRFKASGVTLNPDFAPAKNVLCRIEARTLHSKDGIFVKEDEAVNTDSFVTTSLAISF